MNGYRIIVILIILGLIPAGGHAQLYRYIDENGVERFSNEPPPEGATIIDQAGETKYDEAADRDQQERNREAAAAASNAPAVAVPAAPAGNSVQASGGSLGEAVSKKKKYSRRKHRRKKEIREEQAEAKKAAEAIEGKKPQIASSREVTLTLPSFSCNYRVGRPGFSF